MFITNTDFNWDVKTPEVIIYINKNQVTILRLIKHLKKY